MPLDDDDIVSGLAAQADIVQQDGRITIDGHDVTREIRTPDIDKAATSVARLPHVREVLVRKFRELGAGGAVVMEGRDIGTVVFPDADLKFYIDASPEERARRRASDPAHTGGQGEPRDRAERPCRARQVGLDAIGGAAGQGERCDLHRHHDDADRGGRQRRC